MKRGDTKVQGEAPLLTASLSFFSVTLRTPVRSSRSDTLANDGRRGTGGASSIAAVTEGAAKPLRPDVPRADIPVAAERTLLCCEKPLLAIGADVVVVAAAAAAAAAFRAASCTPPLGLPFKTAMPLVSSASSSQTLRSRIRACSASEETRLSSTYGLLLTPPCSVGPSAADDGGAPARTVVA